MFDCHCDVYVFRDRILVSDYDAADEIQSECARVEDGHQSYVKIIFQPSALTDYATAKHMRDWDCSIDASYLPEWWRPALCRARAAARAELWRQARVFTKGPTQVCPTQSQGHTYFVFGEAEVEGFSHCVVHAYGESKVMAGKWCQVYAHDCSTVAAADNSYVELRDGSEGSILNGRMDMCSSASGEYQGFSTGHIYGCGLTHVFDCSCVSVYGEESHISARGQSIISHHNGFVEAHGSVIVISEEPANENQIHLFDHAQKILRSKI